MLSSLGYEVDFSAVQAVASPESLMQMREEIKGVFVSEHIRSYIVDLVQRTRASAELESGASPRASICLYQGGKSLAAMAGRDYVIPEDIAQIFLPVLSHRVRLSRSAQYSRKTAEEILKGILSETPVPPEGQARFDAKGTE